jgi:hypothetical protein
MRTFKGDYSSGVKRFYIRLRRHKAKQLHDKLIEQGKETYELNKEICEEFKFVDVMLSYPGKPEGWRRVL